MKTSIPVRVGDQVRVQGPTGFGHGRVVDFNRATEAVEVDMVRYNGDLTDLHETNRFYGSLDSITHVLETVTRWVKR